MLMELRVVIIVQYLQISNFYPDSLKLIQHHYVTIKNILSQDMQAQRIKFTKSTKTDHLERIKEENKHWFCLVDLCSLIIFGTIRMKTASVLSKYIPVWRAYPRETVTKK